jgi:succinate dehydrogenase / fumarate reductase cytochrome b subunit
VRIGYLPSKTASLLGLLPVGVWTVNHLWDNLHALRGAEAWERSVTQHRSPAFQLATYAVVLLPLAVHAIWGAVRIPTTRLQAPTTAFANVRHIVHRLAGLGILAFLGAHLWLALIRPRVLHGAPEAFDDLARQMRFHGPTLVVYVLGVLGTAYHLANGVQAVMVGWAPRPWGGTMNRLSVVAALVFLGTLALGWGAVFALWRAGSFVTY